MNEKRCYQDFKTLLECTFFFNIKFPSNIVLINQQKRANIIKQPQICCTLCNIDLQL